MAGTRIENSNYPVACWKLELSENADQIMFLQVGIGAAIGGIKYVRANNARMGNNY